MWAVVGILGVLVVVAGIIAFVARGDDSRAVVAQPSASAQTGESEHPDADTVAGETEPTVSEDLAISSEAVETATVGLAGGPLPSAPTDSGVIAPADDPAIGQEPPGASTLTPSGAETSVFEGKPTVVVFLAHWCPHCQAEVPRIVEWANEGVVTDEVDLVAVTTAVDPGQPNYPPSEWLANEQWPGRVAVDSEIGEIASAYGISGFPYVVSIDAEGKVARRGSGELDKDQFVEMVSAAMGAG